MSRNSSSLLNLLLALFLITTAGCVTLGAARHKYIMRGEILDVTDGEAYLCVGSAEGARVGQEYTVYRFIRRSPGTQPPGYKREAVGAVKITEVVAEHYAKAEVIRGEINKNDFAELKH